MKRVRIGVRVWRSLDVRLDLFLGLGGYVLADCVMDSVRTLLIGAATPKAGACNLTWPTFFLVEATSPFKFL